MREDDEDIWPPLPRALEDPAGFLWGWLRRFWNFWTLGYLVAFCVGFPVALRSYLRSGEVRKELIIGVGFMVIGILGWIDRALKQRRRGE